MKAEKFTDAIGMLDDDLIAEAEQTRKKHKSKRRLWVRLVAAAACVCVVLACVFGNSGTGGGNDYALAEVEYPEMAPYPNEADFTDEKTGVFDDEGFLKAYDAWLEARQAQYGQSIGYTDGLNGFFSATMQQFLSGAGTENRVYSPLNVYLALSMLAEVTDGNTRQQIMDLLGEEQIESLRERVSALWNANYCEDGAVTSVLANSLWLDETVDFKQSTLDRLAKTYYASSYRGEMGSAEFTQALQDWLNEQTGGLLQEQVSDMKLERQTILALASTIYFKAKWSSEFSESATEAGTFHAIDGDVTCDFMHQSNSKNYFWGDGFSAVTQDLNESGSMWLILPDEGVSVDDLLSDSAIMELISTGNQLDGGWENKKLLTVNLTMPKFDVVSDIDLKAGLEALGVTDVFDDVSADFSPLTPDIDGIGLTSVKHAARVMVDEEGCTAAAYTVMLRYGAPPPGDEVDFVLDRPFLFVITGADGLPLFAGVVNQPV